ncbi:hypothetical protein O3M35_006921 [Rhynocoris fuscipes]|uniref:Uncharacterized protein n=1 Tax=Rhynocoris fuscipes TaxID=488301 RepID=A0AAW1DFS3_9HEMI
MVRVGEYSPLNGQQRGKTTLGVGEHEEQRKQLEVERKREYKNSLAAFRLAKEQSHSSKMEENECKTRPRMHSASTQTDSEEVFTSFVDNQTEVYSPVASVNSSPCRRTPLELSPRERLLSDLHGSVAMSHYCTALCEKEKQVAYAKALQAQVEEKKRLEEERRRKIREEEELIERRAREQAERLRREYLGEQKKEYDSLQQKQAQEEIRRRRLKEFELKSVEFKKQERQKKLGAEFQHSAFNVPVKNRELPLTRTTFSRSPMLESAPLLDSDRQNILSVKASEFRRNSNYSSEVGPLKLQPGVNLLSPQYNGNANVVNRSSASESTGIIPSEGHSLPFAGHTSPTIVKSEERSALSNSALSNQSAVLSENIQQPSKRPSSPVVPALQTDMLLKKSAKVLDDKRMVCSTTGRRNR